MELGIMQPYFLPYIGYWQLMKAVDKYVVYDDVNYIKGGWINRNNLLVNNDKHMFTIILNNASPFKLINEISIKDDFSKFLKTVKYNYSKAPFYNDFMPVLESICTFENKNLALFIYNSLKEIAVYLGFDTEFILSSSLCKNNNLRGQEKVLDICKLLKAETYINAIGGTSLYDKGKFKENGLDLLFLEPELSSYKQWNESFVSGLSIVDVLMFNGVEQTNILLDKYKLI